MNHLKCPVCNGLPIIRERSEKTCGMSCAGECMYVSAIDKKYELARAECYVKWNKMVAYKMAMDERKIINDIRKPVRKSRKKKELSA